METDVATFGVLDQVQPDWRNGPLDEDTRPAWFGDAVDAAVNSIADNPIFDV